MHLSKRAIRECVTELILDDIIYTRLITVLQSISIDANAYLPNGAMVSFRLLGMDNGEDLKEKVWYKYRDLVKVGGLNIVAPEEQRTADILVAKSIFLFLQKEARK